MTTATTSRFMENVARGAAWLDEQVPDWRDRIDLTELDLANPCLCVLGQVFAEAAAATDRAGYWYALDEVAPIPDEAGVGSRSGWAAEHGFYWVISWEDQHPDATWKALQETWVELIEAAR